MVRTPARNAAFTLIELLVVIAVIALLVGILLPALSGARKEGRAVSCAANIRQVALGVQIYTGDYNYFPPAYVYGSETTGSHWRFEDQQVTNPNPVNGYIHWSYSLLSDGDTGVPEKAFTCPEVHNGGAPATNPGANAADWEPNQTNDAGSQAGSSAEFPRDRQARRMAYTGNAAIFPRNKFVPAGQRRNQLVRDARVQLPSRTILATEFAEAAAWQSVFDGSKSKSHRPITPFIGGSSGSDVYGEPDIGAQARFFYPPQSEILKKYELGPGLIADGGLTQLNAVGRHHPGGKDAAYGGTANFVFIDGHVERTTILESMRKQLWGDQFYSLTGRNTKVGDSFE